MTLNAEQTCASCTEPRPISAFGKYKVNDIERVRKTCNPCRRDREAARYRRDPEVRRRAKATANAHRLQKSYGLTVDDHEALKAAQDERCAICQTATALHVDHDHKTGRVRGLLCGSCNRAIGLMKDQPNRLRQAAAYLENQ